MHFSLSSAIVVQDVKFHSVASSLAKLPDLNVFAVQARLSSAIVVLDVKFHSVASSLAKLPDLNAFVVQARLSLISKRKRHPKG